MGHANIYFSARRRNFSATVASFVAVKVRQNYQALCYS